MVLFGEDLGPSICISKEYHKNFLKNKIKEYKDIFKKDKIIGNKYGFTVEENQLLDKHLLIITSKKYKNFNDFIDNKNGIINFFKLIKEVVNNDKFKKEINNQYSLIINNDSHNEYNFSFMVKI